MHLYDSYMTIRYGESNAEAFLHEYDAIRGWKNKEDTTAYFVVQEDRVKSEIKINSKGLRGPEYDYPKPAGVKRILLLGDSIAAGFEVLSDYAEVQYKYTAIYNPKGESVIIWNDPSINIEWFTKNPILSNRDKYAQTLSEWLKKEESNYFRFLK